MGLVGPGEGRLSIGCRVLHRCTHGPSAAVKSWLGLQPLHSILLLDASPVSVRNNVELPCGVVSSCPLFTCPHTHAHTHVLGLRFAMAVSAMSEAERTFQAEELGGWNLEHAGNFREGGRGNDLGHAYILRLQPRALQQASTTRPARVATCTPHTQPPPRRTDNLVA